MVAAIDVLGEDLPVDLHALVLVQLLEHVLKSTNVLMFFGSSEGG